MKKFAINLMAIVFLLQATAQGLPTMSFANVIESQTEQLQHLLDTKEKEISAQRKHLERLKIDLALARREVEVAQQAKETSKVVGISMLVIGAGLTVYGARAANNFWTESGGDITGPIMPFIRIGAVGVAVGGTALASGGAYKIYVSAKTLDQVAALVDSAETNLREQEAELAKQESEINILRDTIKSLSK